MDISSQDLIADLDVIEGLSAAEKVAMGIAPKPHAGDEVDQAVIAGYGSLVEGVSPVIPLQSIARPVGAEELSSDSDLSITFGRMQDALDMRALALGIGITEAEVRVCAESSGYALRFMPTIHQRPGQLKQLIAAIRDGYELHTESDAALEGVLVEWNPYHDADSGKFTSPTTLAQKGTGSYSIRWNQGDKKKRVTGGKDGVPKMRKAQKPCGREARVQGDDRRCADKGKKMGESKAPRTVADFMGEAWPEAARAAAAKARALLGGGKKKDEPAEKPKSKKKKEGERFRRDVRKGGPKHGISRAKENRQRRRDTEAKRGHKQRMKDDPEYAKAARKFKRRGQGGPRKPGGRHWMIA
tara:strand:+ start:275 stop:1342 length:1068 start_codon:yes stop_codon:yes gene_type:complete